MLYRTLGRTGVKVSAIALGTGPIAGLMTGDDATRQRDTLRRAIELGINWIDTAAGYGQGVSESSLGLALQSVPDESKPHLATKVRLLPDQLNDIPRAVRDSVTTSLQRLQVPQVTLLQLHNAVTKQRGDVATSLTLDDVLGERGVVSALRDLQAAGMCRHLGFTAAGDTEMLQELVCCGEFDTLQIPFNLANPSAGYRVAESFLEQDYAQIIDEATHRGMGTFAIRVFAAGALLGAEPTEYTRQSRYFPIELYRRDRAFAQQLASQLPERLDVKEAAIRFPLSHSALTAAIVGVASPQQLEEVVAMAERGPLSPSTMQHILSACRQSNPE